MFNFFKPKTINSQQEPHKDDTMAIISYAIKRDSNKAFVDIELRDYDDESINALCSLLNILGNDLFYIDTVDVIKESFLREKREDILIHILTKVNENIKFKLLNAHTEKIKDEPCVKPSDMLK